MLRSILHLIDSIDPAAGGPVEFLRAISREHSAMGHRVCAALLTWPDGPAPEGLEILMAGGKRRFGGYGFRTGLIAWLRREAPRHDAIFVHGLWQYHGAAAWLALSSRDTPYYVFPHGMLDPWFTADRALHRKKRLYWSAVERHVVRKARALLFTSESEMGRAPQSFGRSWRAQEVVPLGIADPPDNGGEQREAFLARFPQLRNRPFILFLGRIDRKKGCDLLVRAFVELNPAGLDLVFAGPCADEKYGAELASISSPRIHFTGMLHGAEKWGAYRCAEVFALPSHQENFAIALVEALACGLPALISTAVAIHPIVTEAGAGFAEDDDLSGVRRLLERWLALSAEGRAQMKSAAIACFREHFHISQTATHMLSLIDRGGGEKSKIENRNSKPDFQ